MGLTAVLVVASPAHAGSGSSDGVTVTVNDLVWPGYACVTQPVTVNVDAGNLVGWLVAVQAGPTAGSRLDSVAFAGFGTESIGGGLLLCPADSDGPWTAKVTGRIGLSTVDFAVGFLVSKAVTAATIDVARRTPVGTRVRGEVLAGSWAGRGTVKVSGFEDGRWRVLGRTYARKDGRYRFVSPKRVARVYVEYLGDNATLASQAGPRRVSTSSSS